MEKYLIEHGANPDAMTKDNNISVLHSMVFRRRYEVIRYMVSKGVDVNDPKHTQADGDTLLHSAFSEGSIRIARYLISHGCGKINTMK